MQTDATMYIEWIFHEIARTGVKQADVAKAMGISASKMSKALRPGGRRFQPQELQAASDLFGSPIPSRRRPLVSSYDPDEPDRRVPEIDHQPDFDPDAQPDLTQFPQDAILELVPLGGMGSGQTLTSVHRRDGFDTVQQDQVKDDYWRFPSTFVRNIVGTSPASLIVVECTGDSMRPTLEPGERVWVNTAHKVPSPDGIYAIRDPLDQIIVKRVELIAGRPPRLRIISDNPMHAPRDYGMEDVTIVGKVVAGLRLF